MGRGDVGGLRSKSLVSQGYLLIVILFFRAISSE